MNHPLPALRLALVASSLVRGGAEKQFVYIARALFEAGLETRCYYLGRGGHYASVLRRRQIPVCQIYRPNRPWYILARLTGALRRFRPHLVLMSQFADILFGALPGRGCGALTLAGIRSDGFYELRSQGWRSRWLLALAHGLIANSHRAKQNLVTAWVNPRRIEVLPNVIDLEEFDARARRPAPGSLPADRPLLAAVGNLHPCKRFDRFLAALALARRQEPALCGCLVGADYGARAALEEQAQTLGLLPDHVRFLGASDQVPALLARADGLVLCSDYEGFPNVILEAMAARRPVITTPVGEAGQLVQDGVTGLVVAPDDAPGLADGMLRLVRCPELAAQWGAAGRRRAEQEYQFTSLFDRLWSIFHTFASRHQRQALLQLLGPAPALNATCLSFPS